MDIKQKTLGMLIDELITTSMKCWYAQEVMNEVGTPDGLIAEAFKKAQTLNARRNALIKAIDEIVGQADFSPTGKTYK
jgi:hypothetical protein